MMTHGTPSNIITPEFDKEAIQSNLNHLNELKLITTGPDDLKEINRLLIHVAITYAEVCRQYGLKV